ncbi:hypothetical protein D3C73_1532750 [compost metagenome]
MRTTHQRTDHGQVFRLDQRHLACIADTRAGAVTRQAGFQACLYRVELDHRRVALGPHADPANAALLGHFGE